jgi:hypothetical protein
MSSSTLKGELTGAGVVTVNLTTAKTHLTIEGDRLARLKEQIIVSILSPGVDIMSGYIVALHAYLNNTEAQLPDGSGNKQFEWRSSLSHTHTVNLCSGDTNYGDHTNHTNNVHEWVIERWQKYSKRTTFGWYLCATYANQTKRFTDISHTVLEPLTSAPYNLDPEIYTISTLKSLTGDWVTGMEWIYATTHPSNSESTYYGAGKTWGINEALNGISYGKVVMQTQIDWSKRLEGMNSRYLNDNVITIPDCRLGPC